MKRAFKKNGLICTMLGLLLLIANLPLHVKQQQSQLTNTQNQTAPRKIDESLFQPSNWLVRGGCWDFAKNIISARAIVGSCNLYYNKTVYQDFTFEARLNKLAETGGFGLLIRYDEQKDG